MLDESLRIELDIDDMKTIVEMRKGSGHYTPHQIIDMRRLAQNYLATSARISTACIKSFMTKDGRL